MAGWLTNIKNTVTKAGHDIGHQAARSGHDVVNEVKRHPAIYGTAALGAAGLGLGAMGGLSGLASIFHRGGAPGPSEDGTYTPDPNGGETGSGLPSLSDVGGFLAKHKNDILDYGQAAEGAYDKYRNVQDYNRRKPLRDAGMAGLLDTSTPDTSAVFADPTNPTGKYRSVSVGSRGRSA